jgi:hypothetical protein
LGNKKPRPLSRRGPVGTESGIESDYLILIAIRTKTCLCAKGPRGAAFKTLKQACSLWVSKRVARLVVTIDAGRSLFVYAPNTPGTEQAKRSYYIRSRTVLLSYIDRQSLFRLNGVSQAIRTVMLLTHRVLGILAGDVGRLAPLSPRDCTFSQAVR